MAKDREKLPKLTEEGERDKRERAEIKTLLQSERGKTLLAWMERQYDGALVKRVEGAVDVNQTLINVGAREVVHDLRSIRDSQDREE
jgi:hypothetical protein